MLTMLALIALGWASCDLGGPSDAPLAVELGTGLETQLIVELWVRPDGEPWVREMLEVLDSRGIHAAIVVPLPDDGAVAQASLLREAASVGHEIVLSLAADEVPKDAQLPLRPLRRAVKSLGGSTEARIRAVIAPMASRHSEPLLGQAGFRTILTSNGPTTATARPAKVFEGQPRNGVVLHSGPYEGDCGTSPIAPVWTPAAADRVSRALLLAGNGGGTSTVRTSLSSTRSESTDADVLARWLDEAILPSGITIVTPSEAREVAMRSFRQAGSGPTTAPAPRATGRVVDTATVLEAAGALVELDTLPRSLPGELTPTEAFHGLVSLLVDELEGERVRLRTLQGPRSEASSSLTGPHEVPRSTVIDLARALHEEWPSEVPSALPIDGRLLTAGEVLLLFASAASGADPAVTRPVVAVDPNAPGLGWGSAGDP